MTTPNYNSDSASDRLAAVRSAINACLTAQSYSVAGRMKAMAQLKELRAMEKELQEEVDRPQGGGMCSLGMQTDPR